MLLLYSSFVHHKSLRYELNHLIAIIRLSQFVIGIDGRTRIFLVNVDVVNFNVSFYFYFIFVERTKTKHAHTFRKCGCRQMQNTHCAVCVFCVIVVWMCAQSDIIAKMKQMQSTKYAPAVNWLERKRIRQAEPSY